MEHGILFPKSEHSQNSVGESTKTYSCGIDSRSEYWDNQDGRTVSSSEAKQLDALISKLFL